jgi:DNA mismatch repair protein MutS2
LSFPVKSEYKRRIPGVVHGASSSGQTVYLEPLETIEQNNELVRLIEEEQAETRRIFLAMTAEIGLQGHAIAQGAATLAQLDGLQARARFAAEFDCIRPRFADPGAVAGAEAGPPPFARKALAQPASDRGAADPGAERRPAAAHHQRPQYRRQDGRAQDHRLLGMMAQAGIPVPAAEAVFPL